MIEDYFEFLKKVTIKSPLVKKFRLIKEFIACKSRTVRGVRPTVILKNKKRKGSRHPASFFRSSY